MSKTAWKLGLDVALSLLLTAAVILNGDLITGVANEAEANMPPTECGGIF